MSIPEVLIEAASIFQPTAEVRARAVILALAENLPEDAIEKALDTYYEGRDWRDPPGLEVENMRAAIAAFLKHVAGELP